MPEAALSILLVDDDRELASLMSEFFREHGLDLKASYNGPDGLREALSGRYHLVLLDVMMPGFDGFELLQQLRRQSQVPVLMLTARTEAPSRIRGLEAGADDYLPKPFDPMELLARTRAILRRTRGHEPKGVLEVSGVRLEPASRRVFCAGKPIEVTTVEYDILETLMRAAGRVVSRDELTQKLYQRTSTPLDRAIDVHVSHLRKKLGEGHDYIRTVRGIGYQFVVEAVPDLP